MQEIPIWNQLRNKRQSNMNRSERAEGKEKWNGNHNLVATKLKKRGD